MALSKHLRQFADSLAPSDEIILKARQATWMVQGVLHQVRGISVARVVPLGSYAKKTSLGHDMDIDLHVFLNNEMPPFSGAMDKIAKELRRLDRNLSVTSHAIKLKVNRVDVDVVPATNFVDKYVSNDVNDAQNQIANVYHYLTHEAGPQIDKKRDFSTSLSEGAVEFEKRHSAFSHAMSRLAKYWSTKMVTQHKPKGKSSIMEYLGARAAEDEESTGSQDLLSAFRRFLCMVQKPQSIFIYWEYFYKKGHIPVEIMKQRPLLLDPSNPNDNFLKGVSHAYYNDLSRFAGETLLQLSDAERRGTIPVMFREVRADTIFWPKSI